MSANPSSRANPAQRAEKQVRAFELKLEGYSLRAISAAMKAEGYTGIASAESVRKLIELEAKQRVSPLAEQLRTQETERLEGMTRAALEVLGRDHVVVSQGRIVRQGEPQVDYDDEGNPIAVINEAAGAPVFDDGPKLKAIETLLRVRERMAKLHGLDAPEQVNGNLAVKYTVEGVDMSKLQ
jgi:hypothetical protein